LPRRFSRLVFIILYADDPHTTQWESIDLAPPGESLGEWEPTYNVARVRDKGILSMFALKVVQGNQTTETKTITPPQIAYLLEAALG
jgi:hypothetical protein